MIVKTLIFLVLIYEAHGDELYDECTKFEKCDNCIQNPLCVWCPVFEVEVKCRLHSTIVDTTWCSETIVEAKPSIVLNTNNNLDMGVDSKQIVQIKPQHVTLKIPVNREETIKFQFQRAYNPLDLYFLMDASNTMSEHKKILSKLGEDLVKTMKSLTHDFKLGFGTFIDKEIFPIDVHPNKPNGLKAHSFRNRLNLTDDWKLFQEAVNSTGMSGNLDFPEGGLDAFMQVVVCADIIGWRKNVTKIVVISTDEMFHFAGDGRLAGIVEPNDGRCHLVDNVYTKNKIMDYPSLHQVNYVAREHDVYILYAIVRRDDNGNSDDVIKAYENLVMHSKNENITHAYNSVFDDDVNDVIDKLKLTYQDILSSVSFNELPKYKNVEASLKFNCEHVENKCVNMTIGEAIDFEVKIKALNCDERYHKYEIKPVGINESLVIDLEIVCECDCEPIANSPNCNGKGNEICGVCDCTEGHGMRCECDGTYYGNDTKYCIDPSNESTCNGNGLCNGCTCECNDKFYGKYCECNDESCPKNVKGICSGMDHGRCVCGECVCDSSWIGDECSCPTSNANCKPFRSDIVCSSHGYCDCGECKCDPNYTGDYCEICTNCDECVELNPCVEEFLENVKSNKTEPPSPKCANVNVSMKVESFYDDEWSKCLIIKPLCKVVYRHKTDKDGTVIVEAEPERCTFLSFFFVGLPLIILSTIILAGIISLLIWKGVVSYKDEIEFAKFEREQRATKFQANENPLYKSAVTTFNNPSYKQQTASSPFQHDDDIRDGVQFFEVFNKK